MTTRIRGGYYRVLSQYIYHAYVTADPDLQFDCYLGIDGPDNHPDAAKGDGAADFAKIICCMDPADIDRTVYGKPLTPTLLKDSSGILYGLTGVCHQMCNRILFAAGRLNFPDWWMVPYVVYGFYGNRYRIRSPGFTSSRKYNWQEYLSAATLLFEGTPLTDDAIAAGVPEVRRKVLAMTARYSDWAELIRMEVAEVGSIELPLKRAEFFLRRSSKTEMSEGLRPLLRDRLLDLGEGIRRLRREVERTPGRFVPALFEVDDKIRETMTVISCLVGDERFEKSFALPGVDATTVIRSPELEDTAAALGEQYRALEALDN